MTQHRWEEIDLLKGFEEILWKCGKCGYEIWSWKRPRDRVTKAGKETIYAFDGDSWYDSEIPADCDETVVDDVMEV